MSVPKTTVQLRISCRNLKKMDRFTESDPMAVLFQLKAGNWKEVDRSEMIKNTKDPDFQKFFTMEYHFEARQDLRIAIYDVDVREGELHEQDFIGEIQVTLGELMGASHGSFSKKLEKKGKPTKSYIHIQAEEKADAKGLVQIAFRGSSLDKKDFFGKSDPFLTLASANSQGKFTVFKKTEVIKKTLDPTWSLLEISVAEFCNGDYNRPIQIKCYDWDSDGSHDLIGICETSLSELQSCPNYDLINPKKQKKKKKYKNSGTLHVDDCRILPQHTFLDYILGGFELSVSIAVDFTASNGAAHLPQSLHYRNPYAPNQYQQAIHAVGNIIEEYDTDKLFPALGFGSRDPLTGQVQHLISLTGDINNPYCAGFAGVMKAYQDTLDRVTFWGPTHFAPIIDHVAEFAAAAQNQGNDYLVLLIITDGVVNDLEDTKRAIVNASKLPMSIIIVGVGNADFASMEQLDGDDVQLSYRGQTVERDIVQFVPFRHFTSEHAQEDLAQEVLAEIPDQFVAYMKKRNIVPSAPRNDNWEVKAQASIRRTATIQSQPSIASAPSFNALL